MFSSWWSCNVVIDKMMSKGIIFYYVGLGHFNNCSRTFFTELFYRKQNQLFIVTILYIDGFFFSISLKKL